MCLNVNEKVSNQHQKRNDHTFCLFVKKSTIEICSTVLCDLPQRLTNWHLRLSLSGQ